MSISEYTSSHQVSHAVALPPHRFVYARRIPFKFVSGSSSGSESAWVERDILNTARPSCQTRDLGGTKMPASRLPRHRSSSYWLFPARARLPGFYVYLLRLYIPCKVGTTGQGFVSKILRKVQTRSTTIW